MVVMVTSMPKLTIDLKFQTETSEGSFCHQLMYLGDQTVLTHVQTSLGLYIHPSWTLAI